MKLAVLLVILSVPTVVSPWPNWQSDRGTSRFKLRFARWGYW